MNAPVTRPPRHRTVFERMAFTVAKFGKCFNAALEEERGIMEIRRLGGGGNRPEVLDGAPVLRQARIIAIETASCLSNYVEFLAEGGHTMKKMGTKYWLAALALTLSSAQAAACAFDTDCSPGSKCVRPSGKVIGMCTGGQFPGNQYDQKPYRDPFDPNRTAGKTCSFNIECGPGSHCQMGLGITGVCVRN